MDGYPAKKHKKKTDQQNRRFLHGTLRQGAIGKASRFESYVFGITARLSTILTLDSRIGAQPTHFLKVWHLRPPRDDLLCSSGLYSQ
jgi:hypothetical protein